MTTPTTVNVRLQLRADTAANWTAANPILLANEVGLETDTKKLKIGNGSSAWNSLAYFPSIVSGGTVLGNLEIGSTGTLTFEGSTADGFETTLAVTNPTADRTITLPNQSGTVVVSGNASIVDADIAANAEIAVSKLADGSARQLLQTDAAGTGVEWTSNVDIPGTLDVTSTATFDGDVTVAGNLTVNGTTTNINTQNLVVEDKNIILGDVATPTDVTADGGGITLKGATDKTINWVDATDAWTSSERFSVPLGNAASPSLTFTGDENTGLYSPGADQVAIATGGTGRLFVDASGNVGAGTSTPATLLHVDGGTITSGRYASTGAVIIRRAEGTQASPTAIASSTALSNVVTRGYDGAAYRDAANIQIFSDGAISSTSSPGFITFGTTPSGSTTTQERLRVTSAGLVGVGTSSPSGLLHLQGASIAESWYTATNAGGATWRVGTADTSSGLSGAYRIYDATNSAARLLITSTGNVGIGTTSPGTVLAVTGTSQIIHNYTGAAAGFAVGQFNSSGDASINNIANAPILFATNNTERARIDSSGRLLVGTSTSRGLGAKLQVVDDSSSNQIEIFRGSDAATSAPAIRLYKSKGTTASPTEVSSGDNLGYIVFRGHDGAGYADAAWITAIADGTWTDGGDTTDNPGALVFSTTADGASSPTERMRIRNDGVVIFGNPNSPYGDTVLQLRRSTDGVGNFEIKTSGLNARIVNSSGQGKISIETGTAVSDNNPIELCTGGSGTVRLRVGDSTIKFPSITTTASAANAFLNSADSNSLLRSTSSLRYKTDVEDLEESKADAILNFRPVWYRSTASADRSDWSWYGLIAEEVADIEPRLVHWTYLDDAYEEVDGEKQLKPDAQLVPDGVQYDRLTVLLLDVVKRQQQTIADLEARVAALETP